MKKLNINLSDISGKDLNNREKLSLQGGDQTNPLSCCGCGCCSEGSGGSDHASNEYSNWVSSYYSPDCPQQSCISVWPSHVHIATCSPD